MVSVTALKTTLDDPQRLRALKTSGLVDSAPDPVFDRFTALVCEALRVPVSVFSLVEPGRQFFKSARGLAEPWASSRQTPLTHCFCQYAVHTRETLVVDDTRLHRWVCSNGAIDDMGVIAYLGVPVLFMGKAIGALAAIDDHARAWDNHEIQILQQLTLLLQRELTHRDVHAEVAQAMQIVDEKNRALQAMQTALARSERRIRMIADNLPALVCYIDEERRYRFTNATYARWLKCPPEQLSGRRISDVHGVAQSAVVEPFIQRAFSGQRCDFEYAVEHETGLRHLRGSYVPDFGEDGRVIGIYGLTQDATALKRTEQELRQLAQFDSLTGAANRNLFNDTLGAAIARSDRSGLAMALVFLDLDRFKAINDAHGHQCGDDVLKEFARRLQGCVRATDLVARLAGDEFVLILEALSSAAGAETVARQVLTAMQPAFDVHGQALLVSCSIGVAVRRADEHDPEVFLQRADQALYAAKARGRNCFEIAA